MSAAPEVEPARAKARAAAGASARARPLIGPRAATRWSPDSNRIEGNAQRHDDTTTRRHDGTMRSNEAMEPMRDEVWLPDMDLNHDKQIQSLLCYRYTIGQAGRPTNLKNPE
jgi:hypothetical protein